MDSSNIRRSHAYSNLVALEKLKGKEKMILNQQQIISLFVWIGSLLIVYLLRKSAEKGKEKYSKWELAHVFYGIGLAAFFFLFTLDKSKAIMWTILSVISWEVYEQIKSKTPQNHPFDTILDVTLGIGAGWLFLLIL